MQPPRVPRPRISSSNGDFSSPVLAPWTASGYAANARVEKYDVSGVGANAAYGCEPGGASGRPPFPPHVLQQAGVIAVPIEHELSLDIAAKLSLLSVTATRADGDGLSWTAEDRERHLPRSSARAPSARGSVRASSPAQAGTQTLRIEIDYQGLVRPNMSPRVWVDNVQLLRATRPSFSMRGERRLGTKIEFWLEGTPSSAFVLFLAGAPAPTPLAIPGILGTFELDLLTTLPLLSGALDAQGAFAQSFAIPQVSGFAGLPLRWQALEFGKQTPSLGPSSLQAFYN